MFTTSESCDIRPFYSVVEASDLLVISFLAGALGAVIDLDLAAAIVSLWHVGAGASDCLKLLRQGRGAHHSEDEVPSHDSESHGEENTHVVGHHEQHAYVAHCQHACVAQSQTKSADE